MTQRERFLSILMAAAFVIVGGYTAISTQIIRPMQERHTRIDRLTKVRDDLLRQARHLQTARTNWQERTGRTLSADWREAQRVFYDDLHALGRAAGLTDLRLNPRQPRVERKGDRVDFSELTVAIDARGTLAQLTDFLQRFYRRPYYARIDSLRLIPAPEHLQQAQPRPAASRTPPRNNRRPGERAPASGGGGASPARSADDSDLVLTVTLELTTLVLPQVATAPSKPLDPNVLHDEQALALADPGRLASTPADYDRIPEVNIFKLYREPPPVVVTPDPPPPVARAPDTPKPPPGPPPIPWGEFVLIGTRSLDGEAVVDVRDPRAASGPATPYVLNAEIHDGTIVLIHPIGMVVRVWNADGSGTDWVYKLGKPFSAREVLDPELHPELYHEVQIALAPPAPPPTVDR